MIGFYLYCNQNMYVPTHIIIGNEFLFGIIFISEEEACQ